MTRGREADMSKVAKRIMIAVGIILLAVVLIVGGYVAYLMITYNRIADSEQVSVDNNPTAVLQRGVEYSAGTYNIGFGAYTPDYTFFMDEGVMADGAKTVGKRSVAVSKESVQACTQGAIDTMKSLGLDFMLLQEVDTDSTRSYQVDQKRAFEEAFPTLSSAFAVNFHSAYLAYPINEHHGIVNAGLLTMGDARVDSAVRRSYPVDDSFPTKFFDLDRCFLVERLPVEGGKQLVLVNSHMSAYDEGGIIRAKQLAMLEDVMEQEAVAGNYVIVGGDWNHALCNSLELYKSAQQPPPWVSVFSEADLPQGFSVVRPGNLEYVATCRGADIPYEKGYTYTVTVDGFIVSSNVKATAENIDTGYAYSDHNPVKLSFTLMP